MPKSSTVARSTKTRNQQLMQVERPSSIFALIPPRAGIGELQKISRNCHACDLWKNATQTVFGEGAKQADIFLIGEQPGDQEDRAGHPFVGPAGKLLDQALADAGIERADVYVTSVVKHFKWTPAERGRRRIHKKPRASEIEACRPWLDAELDSIQPKVIVCLGATAAQALLGNGFRVTKERGKSVPSPFDAQVLATVHPSSILRAPDEESRRLEFLDLVKDLREVKRLLKGESR
jgi:uracil-DNA glycosylase family protein